MEPLLERVPKEKLVIGLAMYGRTYKFEENSTDKLEGSVGIMPYYQVNI